jgi:uncharacterized membrane protein YbhN (UPF0104 family)
MMPDPGPAISDIIAAATEPGNSHARAVVGVAPGWLVAHSLSRGLAVNGYLHTIDTSAVRHIIARHYRIKIEKSRGQLPLSDSDLLKIPEIIGSPDQIVFGAENPRHQPMIGYIKRMPDGTILYLEEVRTGKGELAAVSMRKYPATALSGSIAATLEPNGRTDGGVSINIVDQPTKVTAFDEPDKHPATTDAAGSPDLDGQTDGVATSTLPPAAENATPPKPAWRRYTKYLPPVLGVLVLAGIIFGLHGALSSVRPRDILTALAATPQAAILQAAALLAASFCVMLVYDVPGILFARKLEPLPKLTFRRIGLVSFCAYALSHVLGAPALTAAAIRVRLYAQWQIPPAGIARIIALSGTAFLLGAATLIGALLLLHPHDLPVVDNMSAAALRGIGVLLLTAIAFYVLVAQNRPSLSLFGRTLPLPGRLLATGQILLACTDIIIANLILFAVLPAAPGLTASHVLAIYLAGFAAGLFSSLPAGIGVFDTFLLLGFSPYMPAASAIGAILLFRVIYYLVPASIAGLLFAGHEIVLTTKGE